MRDVLSVAPAVSRAQRERRGIVALETTLVTHGLPRPEGLEVALALEAAIREEGAVPATIGVLDGEARVGLDRDELVRLAQADDVAKLGLANLASCTAAGGLGSTTVAATLCLAHLAGIAVMATGGIGGVHHGFVETGDVSADLGALARFPVACVCSGAKALLDLARTREALETLAVPVYGFGTDRFPAFYRRDSGLSVDHRFDDTDRLAEAVALHWRLTPGCGVVVANPVPLDDELPAALLEQALQGALREAEAAGVRGRDVTPFLLDALSRSTAGASVATNRALLESNARLAARLSVALAHAVRS